MFAPVFHFTGVGTPWQTAGSSVHNSPDCSGPNLKITKKQKLRRRCATDNDFSETTKIAATCWPVYQAGVRTGVRSTR